MKLVSMSVKNFRGINGKNTTVSFEGSDIIFLLGQNNVGKSTILTAYEYLVTPKQKAIISDFNGFSEKNPIEIEAVFKKETNDDEIFKKKGFEKWVEHSTSLIRFRKRWTTSGVEGKKETWNPEEGIFVENGFGGLETHFTKHAPTPVRIPAMSTPDELSKWISDIIKKTVLAKLKIEEEETYSKLLKEFTSFQEKILSKDSVKKLGETANINFKKVFPHLTIEVNTDFGTEIDLAKSFEKDFNVTIKDTRLGTINQSFTSHGHGVIRQTMFNFLGLVKNELPVNDTTQSQSKDFIILFEEPEIFLHPKAINSLRKVLYELCTDSPFQILCASHSPNLIDISKPHTSLVRIVKDDNLKTFIHQVKHDLFTGSEQRKKQVQMINRFNPYVCESFFCDEVVIVEGDTEAIVIRELLENLAPERDIFVLNSGSKNNITFFQEIFTYFRINHYIIHDSDTPYIYNTSGEIVQNKDGSNKKNSAWKLNADIWNKVLEANDISPMLARRFVHIPNFEGAHNYKYESSKGKPLSAYDFVKGLDINENIPIVNFVKYILLNDQQLEEFFQENLVAYFNLIEFPING
ncbi:ATP-dependent nuclease [Metabacillus fastidiosus]|uniref:ATP-dependent nuclease n=1 Tax=Metabacillus fastidiosus TaxID=1458 RepID=UPI003D2855F7